MLTFSPKKRYTVEQCITHPYFEGLHDPDQEPTAEKTFNFGFDKEDLTKEKDELQKSVVDLTTQNQQLKLIINSDNVEPHPPNVQNKSPNC